MELRLTVKREVMDKLDCSHFTSEDFNVNFGSSDGFDDLIDIKFKHDDRFIFTVLSLQDGYSITVKPGKMYDEDVLYIDSFERVLNLITTWVNEVRNELKASCTAFEEIDKLRNLISEQLGNQSDEEEFTVEEINTLKRKFSDLEQRVVQLEKDKIITENQLHEFKEGIEQVSEDIEYYPKSTWLKTAPNKLVKLVVSIGKSKEGRKLLTDSARQLLGLD